MWRPAGIKPSSLARATAAFIHRSAVARDALISLSCLPTDQNQGIWASLIESQTRSEMTNINHRSLSDSGSPPGTDTGPGGYNRSGRLPQPEHRGAALSAAGRPLFIVIA